MPICYNLNNRVEGCKYGDIIMKKYFKKAKEFIKKNQLICIGIVAVIVLAIFVYVLFFKLNINTIRFTKKVSGSKNYSVECLDINCDYLVSSNGDKYGKYTSLLSNNKYVIT